VAKLAGDTTAGYLQKVMIVAVSAACFLVMIIL
jgi:hypothetical protein